MWVEISICLCRSCFSDPGDENWLRKWQQNASEPPTCKIIIHCSQQQFWPCYFSELSEYSGQPYVSLSVRDDAVVLVFPTQLFGRSGKAWPVLNFFLFFSSGLSQGPSSKNAEIGSNSLYSVPEVEISHEFITLRPYFWTSCNWCSQKMLLSLVRYF